MPDYTYDGVSEILGVATAERRSPLLSPRALNMDFRDGVKPRWGLAHLQTVFADESDRELFENGNVQKISAYQPYERRPAALMYLIGGSLFSAQISGRWLYVTKLSDKLDPTTMLGWMCQGFEWFITQDGLNNALVWDGYNLVVADPANQEIPIGGPMSFIHHQIVVASTDGSDKIAVSERWAGSQSSNVWKFTSSPYWSSAGIFGLHANFGKIMTLDAVPQIKQTPNGQGDLLIGGSNGFQTLNVQPPRDEWLNLQIQDTALVGTGVASYLGTLAHKASIWYIGEDGLREFRRGQSDFERNDADSHESSDVEYYWDQSNTNLRLFQSLGFSNNRLFLGLMPEIAPSTKWGNHRYCKAWAVLDVSERWRAGTKLPKAWFGVHCGVRPVEWVNVLVNRVHRTYVVSHDEDGKNRTYEVTNHLSNDIRDGKPVPIVSFFDTPPMVGNSKLALRVKTAHKARLDYTDARGRVEFDVDHRGDDETCWKDWGSACAAPFSDACKEPCTVSNAHSGSKVFSDPEETCPAGPASQAVRLRVQMKGRAEIRRIIVGMRVEDTPVDGFSEELFGASCGSCETVTPDAQGCCDDLRLY